MNNYPLYAEVNGKKYAINTDFRIALQCDEIVRDELVGEYEKYLAIIYKLFGEEALKDTENHEQLGKIATKYLRCGKELEELENEEQPSMDFKQDSGYIKASFMSTYGIDLDKVDLHFWFFIDLLKGLTEDCILNQVRYIREEPLAGKKGKEREKLERAKRQVALKREKTQREKELDIYWENILKGGNK